MSSSSDENKKMKSMIEDDDEIKATREKLRLDFHKELGSAENISGHSSVERSMKFGGGLSVPCLTSRLNLNTNSGFGNLSVQGSKKLIAGMLQQEALSKVRREIDVEFRDEANAADLYKVVVLVG
uniref:Probable NOT transcription complex subunit VIP2 n=1 Tax=Tanacetum cinerariifolium TaxID=118510 RepID=A0A699KJW6_TANCI|nr:probable NOT transcription complex subunit VIP2 [Tanacetum cinerariifolium]